MLFQTYYLDTELVFNQFWKETITMAPGMGLEPYYKNRESGNYMRMYWDLNSFLTFTGLY